MGRKRTHSRSEGHLMHDVMDCMQYPTLSEWADTYVVHVNLSHRRNRPCQTPVLEHRIPDARVPIHAVE